MSANDEKIKDLLHTIEKKRSEMGDKPRASWRTNGLIGEAKVNINTVSHIETCVTLASEVIAKQENRKKASELLGVEYKEDYALESTLEDIKMRVSMLKWQIEADKLNNMIAKLHGLRSADAKTADAISEIASLL